MRDNYLQDWNSEIENSKYILEMCKNSFNY